MFDLTKAIEERIGKGIKNYPCDNNRASSLGHACKRALVYERLNWQDKILPTAKTAMIFKLGRILEAEAKRDIDGCEVDGKIVRLVESESMYEYKENGKILCRGKIDGKVEIDRVLYPIEIKSMQAYQFDKMESQEDFLYAEKFWLRKYLAQIQMYLLMTNTELGMLFLVNKSYGTYKAIWIKLDYEFAETIVKQAQEINKYVEAKEYPDRISYTDGVCDKCNFAHICLPDIRNAAGLQIIDNEELGVLLTRRDEIKGIAGEYEKVDKQVKKMIEGKEKVLCGDFMITGKKISKDIPAKEATHQEYMTYKIVNLNKTALEKNVKNNLTIGE